jgi:hypothetical protein
VKFKVLVGNLLVALGVWGVPTDGTAQVEKLFHQVITADEAYILNFALKEDYEVVTWSGKTILVEGLIRLDCCDQVMLSHIVKTGRYALTLENSADVVSVSSKNFPPLTIKGLQCKEQVKFKISVPENYEMVSKGQFYLKDSPVLEAKKQ